MVESDAATVSLAARTSKNPAVASKNLVRQCQFLPAALTAVRTTIAAAVLIAAHLVAQAAATERYTSVVAVAATPECEATDDVDLDCTILSCPVPATASATAAVVTRRARSRLCSRIVGPAPLHLILYVESPQGMQG